MCNFDVLSFKSSCHGNKILSITLIEKDGGLGSSSMVVETRLPCKLHTETFECMRRKLISLLFQPRNAINAKNLYFSRSFIVFKELLWCLYRHLVPFYMLRKSFYNGFSRIPTRFRGTIIGFSWNWKLNFQPFREGSVKIRLQKWNQRPPIDQKS